MPVNLFCRIEIERNLESLMHLPNSVPQTFANLAPSTWVSRIYLNNFSRIHFYNRASKSYSEHMEINACIY